MTRTAIDVDETACSEVMRRYQFRTKQEAVNLALNMVAGDPMTVEEAPQMQGVGWEGDTHQMRTHDIR